MSDPKSKKAADAKTSMKPRPVSTRAYPKASDVIFDPHSQAIKVSTVVKSKTEVTDPEATLTPVAAKNLQSRHDMTELTSPSRIQKSSSREEAVQKEENRPKLVLIVSSVLLVIFGLYLFTGNSSKRSGELSAAAQAALNQKVDYYRNETGRRINRDRVGVEIQNEQNSVRVPETASKIKDADIMSGLPLAPEERHRNTSRDRSVANNPDDPEFRVQQTIDEQQSLNDWEDEARRQYVKEFIENAAREGYKVQVDKDGNAKVVGRLPGFRRPSGDSSPGSVR